MYINDPFDKMIPPKLENSEEIDLEEGPRDYHEFFWDEAIERGRYIERAPGKTLYTEICRFDSQGNHLTMAKNCPHFDPEDEEGRKIRTDWTVQQR